MFFTSKFILYVFASMLSFSCMFSLVKLLTSQGFHVFEMILARSIISLIICLLLSRKEKISIWGQNKKLLALRGFMETSALFCKFFLISLMPLAEATLLQYLRPLLIICIAFVFLRETIEKKTLVSMSISIVGLLVFFLSNLSYGTSLPLWGIVAGLCGALSGSIAQVLLRKVIRVESSFVVIFYFPLIAMPISLFFTIQYGFTPIDWFSGLILVLIGILAQSGGVFMTKAMKIETLNKVTACYYFNILLSILQGWLIFHEVPSLWTILASVFILLGAVIHIL